MRICPLCLKQQARNRRGSMPSFQTIFHLTSAQLWSDRLGVPQVIKVFLATAAPYKQTNVQ